MAKILENAYRAVNIGLVNEMALIADKLGLDIWEVIEAAATKPFGFMKFTPGPGLGGHCLPVDPHYLSWKMRTMDFRTRFIDMASEINAEMPTFVVGKVRKALNGAGKRSRAPGFCFWGWPTRRTSVTCANPRPWTSWISSNGRGRRGLSRPPCAAVGDQGRSHPAVGAPRDALLRDADAVVIVTGPLEASTRSGSTSCRACSSTLAT